MDGKRWWWTGALIVAGFLFTACSSSPRAANRPAARTPVPTVSADSTAGVFLIRNTGRGVVHGVSYGPIASTPGGDAHFWVSVITIQQGVGVDLRVPLSASPTTTVTSGGKDIAGGVPGAAHQMVGHYVTAYVVRQKTGELIVEQLEIGREPVGVSILF